MPSAELTRAAPGSMPSAAASATQRSASALTRPRPSRARRPSASATGVTDSGVAQLRRGEQAEAGAAQEHVGDRARLLEPRRDRRLGEQVGLAGDDRRRELGALAGEPQHVARGVPVAEARAARGSPPAGRPRRGPRAGRGRARRRPSRAGCRRCGRAASRPSRSTIRSTTCLAIRRQVVSLPPVIVSIPDEVS